MPGAHRVRAALVDELVALDGDTARRALGLTGRQTVELARNAALRTAPTLPALLRYTGVLYDALDARSLRRGARARAAARLAVVSALFGLLGADERVPAYRLSAGSVLPRAGSVRSLWRPVLGPVLAAVDVDGPVVDLRSGPYAALAPAPGAVVVRVVDDGRGAPVSHANKVHKGRLARLLVEAPREVSGPDGVARITPRGGLRVERAGERALDVVVPAR